MADNLTVKQEKFVQGLFAGLSQREAYKAAYDCKAMKDSTIDVKASELAKDGKISVRLAELMRPIAEKNSLTVDGVLRDIQSIKKRCMSDEEFNPKEALKACELEGKYLKMFTDTINHTGEVGVRIINDIPRNKTD